MLLQAKKGILKKQAVVVYIWRYAYMCTAMYIHLALYIYIYMYVQLLAHMMYINCHTLQLLPPFKTPRMRV